MSDQPVPTRIVGRAADLARVRAVIGRAMAGESSAVIVTGEPGIGKTALCRTATTLPDDGQVVRLDLNLLPLQALSTGLAPLRTALRASSAPAGLTRACLARMEEGDPIRAMDDWADGVVADVPLIVVVDDIQWADASLRDLVLYLLAGPRDRRLAVLVTARTAGLPDGDPFYRWLADALHLPQVGRLEVGSLDRAGTEAQLADLLGSRPHQSLVEEVHRAGQGNPYLTSLLARNLDAADRHLPAELPGDLLTAVKGAWHGCSPPTRALCCLLAVGGGPERLETLREVAADLALDIDLASSIVEAEAAGLVESLAGGRSWFRHPLQAEVLERSVSEAERRRWQAAFARHGDEAAAHVSGPTLETAIVQCGRHDQAGSAAAAYRWALRAWEIGRNRRGTADLRRVLRRAVALWPEVPDATETLDDLWQRVRHLAAGDGAYAEELEAVEALLAITDETRRPLPVSELLVRRMLLRMTSAAEFLSVDDMNRAVGLAAADRSSWQYGLALAEVAHVGYWRDDPGAAVAAEDALAVARAVGEPTALSFALTASAMVEASRQRHDAARRLAAEAVDAAVLARDWWAYVHGVMWESNSLPEPYGPEGAAYLARRRTQLAIIGGPDSYLVQLAGVEAEVLLDLGDWQACEGLLRESLVSDPGPMADLRFRTAAARLTAYQGRVVEALGHLRRAEDLVGGQHRFRGLSLDVTRAHVLIAARRSAEGYRVAMTAATEPGVPVHMAEYLVPLAARALADQVEQDRDRRQPDSEPLQALAGLRARFPSVIDPDDSSSPLWRQRLAALQAWYDAESARAGRADEESNCWVSTRTESVAGQLPWLEMYACWRGAEAVLRRGRAGQSEGIRLLRAGYDLAVRLAADGVRAELEGLAGHVHVNLARPDPVLVFEGPHLLALTARERELLGYVVQGLTYAEIAKALVISEKTVSSHISNLLRKTNTSSRVELARLVTRIAG